MIPSVGGGIGHLSRTSALAGALASLDPEVEVEFLLDTDRLRPFNIEACRRMGFRPRFLPPRNRDTRDSIVRACLDDAHVIVDDCARYLQPLHRCVPEAAWVSIPMHPVGDELFMDWPFLAQMDLVVWAYAPMVEVPPELSVVGDRLIHTGPFLDTAGVLSRESARRRLGTRQDELYVSYAPRGFPFGREFGHRVLASLYAAIVALRRDGFPELGLELLAVAERSELRGIEGVPDELPEWIRVEGVVSPATSLLHVRAADAVVGEGTSTMHEAASLGTPLIAIPGPIREAELVARGFARAATAPALSREDTTPERLAIEIRAALTPGAVRAARLERAMGLVTGGGGAVAAARRILALADTRRG